MTIDEWVDEVAALGKKGLDDEQLWPAIKQLVLRFGQAEAERCAGVFRKYLDASGGAWGPGASNPPKASDYLNEILGTSPGKAGG